MDGNCILDMITFCLCFCFGVDYVCASICIVTYIVASSRYNCV
jgi:hypothetical protein